MSSLDATVKASNDIGESRIVDVLWKELNVGGVSPQSVIYRSLHDRDFVAQGFCAHIAMTIPSNEPSRLITYRVGSSERRYVSICPLCRKRVVLRAETRTE